MHFVSAYSVQNEKTRDKTEIINYGLHIKSKENYIAFSHDVVASFTSQESCLFDSLLAPTLLHILVTDRFCTDKTFLEVCVNHSGSLKNDRNRDI
jgi:hypothetical protein